MTSAPRPPPLAVVLAALLPAALAGCPPPQTPRPPGTLVVVQELQASWVRNFNPLSLAASARWPTRAGVYEPLGVFNSVRGELVPWLATGSEWLDGGARLRVFTRPGVRWSDGQPFTAADVAFTFDLLRRFPALDSRGVWSFLAGVEPVDEGTVDFVLSRHFFPGRDDLFAVPIVPRHVWREVADPVTFDNPEPVATGPFTEVRRFQHQLFELGRNPHYWQPERPRVEALRLPAYSSNERANLAVAFDEVDWAGNFVPAIERVYVRRDPQHHRYWFPLTGTEVFLFVNTTQAPYADARVRRALSQAIDRRLLIDVALFQYTRPADATGLSDAFAAWRDPEVVAKHRWTHFDPTEASRRLDEAGLPRGADGVRRLPGGARWAMELLVVSGWSDWVRAAQVTARNLRALGVEATVRALDFSAWHQRVQEGRFEATLGWSFEGATPYAFYRWLMSSQTVKPVGEPSLGNWHRYGSPAADAALRAFEVEPDEAQRRALASELQRLFAEEAPAIPLYPNPSWAEYNTKRFRGFPSADAPYADPSPNKFDRGETLLVLTSLEPQ